jgi:hypothetical protein
MPKIVPVILALAFWQSFFSIALAAAAQVENSNQVLTKRWSRSLYPAIVPPSLKRPRGRFWHAAVGVEYARCNCTCYFGLLPRNGGLLSPPPSRRRLRGAVAASSIGPPDIKIGGS